MTGKRAFVMVPVDLLALAQAGKVSDKAFRLYICMSRYVNQGRMEAAVWPGRSRLAGDMGFAKVDNVDRYIAELENAGLIRKERRRKGKANDTNVYTLLPPNQGVPLSQGVPLNEGVDVPPDGGVPVPPGQGAELDEVELDEEELDLSLREDDPASPFAGAALDRERDQRKPKIQTPTTLVAPYLTDPTTAEAVVAEIIAANGVDKPLAFFIHTAGNGTLPELVRLAEAALGDTHDKVARGRFLQEIGWEPKCEHGINGGHIRQPGTGWVTCAQERYRLSRPTPNKLRGFDSRADPSVYDDPEMMTFKPPTR